MLIIRGANEGEGEELLDFAKGEIGWMFSWRRFMKMSGIVSFCLRNVTSNFSFFFFFCNNPSQYSKVLPSWWVWQLERRQTVFFVFEKNEVEDLFVYYLANLANFRLYNWKKVVPFCENESGPRLNTFSKCICTRNWIFFRTKDILKKKNCTPRIWLIFAGRILV